MGISKNHIEGIIYEEAFFNPNTMGLHIEVQRTEKKIILQVNRKKAVINDSNNYNEIVNIVENAVKNCNKASKQFLGFEMFE